MTRCNKIELLQDRRKIKMSEIFDLLSTITKASAESLKSGYQLGFEAGYIAGLKKAEEIRKEVFKEYKDKEAKGEK